MRASERDAALLLDMLTRARRAVRNSETRTIEDLLQDEVFQAAAERWIEIIGEAARGVSAEFCAAHPEIPWKAIRSQRHIVAHDYGELDYHRLWRVLRVHIPELIVLLEPLIPPPPPDPLPENPRV